MKKCNCNWYQQQNSISLCVYVGEPLKIEEISQNETMIVMHFKIFILILWSTFIFKPSSKIFNFMSFLISTFFFISLLNTFFSLIMFMCYFEESGVCFVCRRVHFLIVCNWDSGVYVILETMEVQVERVLVRKVSLDNLGHKRMRSGWWNNFIARKKIFWKNIRVWCLFFNYLSVLFYPGVIWLIY